LDLDQVCAKLGASGGESEHTTNNRTTIQSAIAPAQLRRCLLCWAAARQAKPASRRRSQPRRDSLVARTTPHDWQLLLNQAPLWLSSSLLVAGDAGTLRCVVQATPPPGAGRARPAASLLAAAPQPPQLASIFECKMQGCKICIYSAKERTRRKREQPSMRSSSVKDSLRYGYSPTRKQEQPYRPSESSSP
jgi:hypothetical protein